VGTEARMLTLITSAMLCYVMLCYVVVCFTSNPVTTWMGGLWADKPSLCVTIHLSQLSLPSLRGRRCPLIWATLWNKSGNGPNVGQTCWKMEITLNPPIFAINWRHNDIFCILHQNKPIILLLLFMDVFALEIWSVRTYCWMYTTTLNCRTSVSLVFRRPISWVGLTAAVLRTHRRRCCRASRTTAVPMMSGASVLYSTSWSADDV